MTFNEDWEQVANQWIAWARAEAHDAYWLYRDAFFELVPPPGRATLEVGCGEGRVSRDLKARDHHVVGIDASPTLLRAASEADPDGEYQLANSADLPFEDGAFDLVVAYNSLMDVDDMPGSVGEIARVIEPGGHFCVCITHPMVEAGQFQGREPDAPFVIEGSYMGRRRPPYHGQTFHRNGLSMTFSSWAYPLEDYSRAFEDAGLVIEALREPRVPAEEVEKDPTEHRWARLPNFLMMRLLKPRVTS